MSDAGPSTVTLPLLHFNDVYRLRQTDKSLGGDGRIDASQFARKIHDIRKAWDGDHVGQRQKSDDSQLNGLCLFSGDVFNPSVESSISRGEHMLEPLAAMSIDAACIGNHDFDFGFPHLRSLMKRCSFPWHLSNIADTSADESARDAISDEPQEGDATVPGTTKFTIMPVAGLRVAIIGLVEKDWIETIPVWPAEFKYRSMAATARALSKELRDPEGPHKADLIIALTHSRLSNDIALANEVGATRGESDEHGVDIILGGHDHMYYIGKGATKFEGKEFERPGGSGADNDTFIIKSGTDFRDLSEAALTISAPREGKVRRRRITELSVRRHRTQPSDPPLPELRETIGHLLAKIDESTGQPVAYTLTPWDTRAGEVRLKESACGDLIADIMRISYESVLRDRDRRGQLDKKRKESSREVDMALICGGSLRGDSSYGPGSLRLRDIMEIMPFDDSVVCLELTGAQIIAALENGFSTYPKQEGRFPQISGAQVLWDSTKPPGKRIVSVTLLEDGHLFPTDSEGKRMANQPFTSYDFEKREGGGYSVEIHRPRLRPGKALQDDKTYRVVTREFMADGHDGYEVLKAGKELIGHEEGSLMSALVRRYLLGASMLWRMRSLHDAATHRDTARGDGAGTAGAVAQDADEGKRGPAGPSNSERTKAAIERARLLSSRGTQGAAPSTPAKGRNAFDDRHMRFVVDASPSGIRDALHLSAAEHHSQHDRVTRHLAQASGKSPRASSGSSPESPSRSSVLHLRAQRRRLQLGQDASEVEHVGDLSADTTVEKQIEVSADDAQDLREASADLALVAPIVDGRMRDVATQA
ncbi:5' nucleotidase [Ceraceosorus bombacis]|uniref:5' nucleotidase n=1 Tax=Ceraceosorus bombacis TaxID=401625 RepID=A0A0P1BJL9_9BASI|nr:5' nucleotidase [Ceraceosorus bombacis]